MNKTNLSSKTINKVEKIKWQPDSSIKLGVDKYGVYYENGEYTLRGEIINKEQMIELVNGKWKIINA